MADVIAKWQIELPLRVGDGTSLPQRRCHHQEPPGGPQGPGSYAEENWGHL